VAPQEARVGIFRDWQFGAALAAGPLCWAAWWWVTEPAVDAAWPLRQPLAFLAAVVVYPLLEEIVFRGGLQTFLLNRPFGRGKRCGISAANFLTSALFSLLHLAVHAALWAAAAFFPSLVFGYFRERNASILPAILLHVFYNAGYFWLFA
jgi:membrane protease YdiL (CAAX protease family)